MESNIIDKEEIDKEKLQKLKFRIFGKERTNSKTRKLKDYQMVDDIIKEIMREVDNEN